MNNAVATPAQSTNIHFNETQWLFLLADTQSWLQQLQEGHYSRKAQDAGHRLFPDHQGHPVPDPAGADRCPGSTALRPA